MIPTPTPTCLHVDIVPGRARGRGRAVGQGSDLKNVQMLEDVQLRLNGGNGRGQENGRSEGETGPGTGRGITQRSCAGHGLRNGQ